MSNLSSKVYDTLTHPNTMRILLANFFKDSKDQAVTLLQKSGVAISNSAPAKQVQIAWLKAIKDSASFRAAAADKLTHYVTVVKAKVMGAPKGTNHNFVGSYGRYFNALDEETSLGGLYSSDVSAPDASSSVATDTSTLSSSVLSSGIYSSDTGTSSTASGTTTASAAQGTTASSSGGFWSTLGSIFTPKVIQQGISTGLQAYSTNLTASANASSEKNALALEQTKLAQAQVAAKNPSTGLSTGWKVAIGITIAVAVITGIAVFAHRKK